jgi:hypothetical protein
MLRKAAKGDSKQQQQQEVQAGIIDGGGKLICPRHDFETTDVKKWNEHCSDGDHFEEGNTVCIVCGERIEFSGLPFHPFDAVGSKNVRLKCDECDAKTRGTVKITKQGGKAE